MSFGPAHTCIASNKRKPPGSRREHGDFVAQFHNFFPLVSPHYPGAPNDNFRKNICSEDDLRSRIFGTFVVKFLACLPLLGFSNLQKMV